MADRAIERVRRRLEYPAFNPAIVPVQVDADTIHLRTGPWTGPMLTLRDRDEESDVTKLLELLDGRTHVDDVLDAFEGEQRVEVAEVLLAFAEKTVVYDRTDGNDDRWPHLALRPRFREGDRARLESRSVVVLSCGRMGGQIASDLAAIGVGRVAIVRPVPTAASAPAIEDSVERVGEGDVDAAIGGADFAVYAADRPYPDVAAAVNEAAYEGGTPWSAVQIHGYDGIVGPTVFPDETACYRCFEERVLANVTNGDGFRAYRERFRADPSVTQPRVPALGRMLAGYLTMDLVNLLAFGSGNTAGRVVRVDGLDLSVEINDVLRLPRCSVCGKDPGETETRFASMRDLAEVVDGYRGGGT